jgi:hypothetical protein
VTFCFEIELAIVESATFIFGQSLDLLLPKSIPIQKKHEKCPSQRRNDDFCNMKGVPTKK